MQEHSVGSTEEDWQNLFGEHQWIISRVFASPYTCFGSKCYVGGRTICGGGTHLCDFLFQNRMTNNTALIEIKTPQALLLGGRYRGNRVTNAVYSLSPELSGVINQVLNYQNHLMKEFHQLHGNGKSTFEAFNPKCIVIAGLIESLDQVGLIGTFENFRNTLAGVTIVTFDELLQRIDDMINLIKEKNVQPLMADPTATYLNSMIADDKIVFLINSSLKCIFNSGLSFTSISKSAACASVGGDWKSC